MKKLFILFSLALISQTKPATEDYIYPFGYYNYNPYRLEATPVIYGLYEQDVKDYPEVDLPSYGNSSVYDFVND